VRWQTITHTFARFLMPLMWFSGEGKRLLCASSGMFLKVLPFSAFTLTEMLSVEKTHLSQFTKTAIGPQGDKK
jgi:hypothetical protein